MFIAACFAIVFSFINILDAFINTIPWSIIGGVSVVLYGMISATGVRTIVDVGGGRDARRKAGASACRAEIH